MPSTELGSGVNRAYIYDRQGQSRLLAIPSVEQVGWGRVLCDISQATVSVVVPSAGAEREACCNDLGKIHTWAHTLVVFRDDGRVWEGPVIRLEHTARGLSIVAWDVLGWTKKRRIKAARVLLGTPVIPEAQTAVSRAFSGDDPNVLAFVQTVGTSLGRNVDRDVQVDSAYYADDLSSLADAGLRFTTVGRRIILAAQNTTIGQTALLLPEQHILGEVTVIEDGEALATAASARDDKGHAAYVNAGVAVDPFYGLVESIVSTGAGAQPTAASVTSYATTERNDHYPAPVYLSIPDGAVLNPRSPFPIESLVCGSLVPAISRATCVDVQATFMLTAVNVAQTTSGESTTEQVTITLQPVANEVITAFDEAALSLGLEATL
jgi:hypothetical protein